MYIPYLCLFLVQRDIFHGQQLETWRHGTHCFSSLDWGYDSSQPYHSNIHAAVEPSTEKNNGFDPTFQGNCEVGEMILSKNTDFWGQLRLLNEKGTDSDLIKSSTEFNLTRPHPKRVALEGEISLFQWNWAWWIIIICPELISSVVQTTTRGSSRFHGKKCISWYTKRQSCLENPRWK